MGWFSELFRPKKRDQSYTGHTPQSATSFPEYKSLDLLQGRIGEPSSYANLYERELANPRRDAAIRDFTQNVAPEINQQYSARGLGHSTLPARDIGNARTDLGLQLAMARGQDRARGLDRGFRQKDVKINTLGSLLNKNMAQNNLSANFDWTKYQNEQNLAQQQQQARQAGMGRLLEFGSNIVTPFLPSPFKQGIPTPDNAAGGMTGAMAGIPRRASTASNSLQSLYDLFRGRR